MVKSKRGGRGASSGGPSGPVEPWRAAFDGLVSTLRAHAGRALLDAGEAGSVSAVEVLTRFDGDGDLSSVLLRVELAGGERRIWRADVSGAVERVEGEA